MRLGRPSLVLALVAPALTGCGLFDTGSTLDEAFEYLPADTFSVRFADRAAMAKRLDLDDIDPRDVNESAIDDYIEPQLTEDVAISTAISPYLDAMKDAPINDFDIEWEAHASWGDDPARPAGSAYVWKVGDDVEFDDLADDLEDKGYEEVGSSDLPIYSVDLSAADPETGLVGGVYPRAMHTVLLAEDEQIVAAGHLALDALGEVAEVVADDADSLADDGGMDDLLDVAEGDPELALLVSGGPGLCATSGRPVPKQAREQYDDLGRPDSRALFISADDPEVLLALEFDSEDAAGDDLEAREKLIEDGVDAHTAQPFDALGDFELEQEGEFVLIEEDFADGSGHAVGAERDGGGPGVCPPDPHAVSPVA